MVWQVISSVAAAIGLFILAWQIWQTKKLSETAFEDSLSQQYRGILRSIPVKALLGEELSQAEFENAENGIYHYLDLSNEQVFLRQKKRVGLETWKSWRDGIKSNLSRTAFDQVWKKIKLQAPDSFQELRELENGAYEVDPACWSEFSVQYPSSKPPRHI